MDLPRLNCAGCTKCCEGDTITLQPGEPHNVVGTGHEIRGNVWRGTTDGAFNEATTVGYDLNGSVVDVTGNDGYMLDRGGNTITANGSGGPNIRQAGSLAQTTAQNRAEFEAACAALGLNTTVTTGL